MGRLKQILDGKDHWELAERIMQVKLVPGKAVRSPLRKEDRNPSFNVYRGDDNKVRWKDFAAEGGDIYSLAMHWYQCDFAEALKKLAVLAGVEKGEMPRASADRTTLALKAFKNIERTRVTYEFRPWSLGDERFWSQFGITQSIMRSMNAFPCKSFCFQHGEAKSTLFEHTEQNPMYVYSFGDRAKLYRPFNPNPDYRYMGNTSSLDVFGLTALKNHPRKFDHTLISAGQKDAMTNVANLRVHGISFNSENIIVNDKIMYDIILTTPGETFIMYDGDKTGRENQEKLCKKYPTLKPIDIGEYTSCKDPSQMVQEGRLDELAEIYRHIHGT